MQQHSAFAGRNAELAFLGRKHAYAGKGSSRHSGGSSSSCIGSGSGGVGVGVGADAADFDITAGAGAFYHYLSARSFSHRPAIPNVTLFDMGDIGRLGFTGAEGSNVARGIAGA
ncbi:MAG: hypothetical protein H5T33_05900 [Candidatus Methanosuratus sp.]|nr:hypothetical protein [Candidatus Methanosuratincola sp.]